MTGNTIEIGDWRLDVVTGRLHKGDVEVELEPKTMAVLVLLHHHRGQVVSHETILDDVWCDSVVSVGALARCISKLRKALGDDAQSPRYIETLPKRGYRLLDNQPKQTQVQQPPEPQPQPAKSGVGHRGGRVWLALALTAVATIGVVWFLSADLADEDPRLRRADDFYYQYTRADNESAMALYERVIAQQPDSAPATLGLANTLIQLVLRWPETLGEAPSNSPTLRDALATQRTQAPRAQLTLERAESLASRAVRLDANNPKAHRSLGLVYAARGRFEDAHDAYDRALSLDPQAWGTLINKAELYNIQDQPRLALAAQEQAYAAMTVVYDEEPVRVRPWYADLGHAIADQYAQLGQFEDAEIWYRRVLEHTPYHVASTVGLARLLHAAGDRQKAAELCRRLTTRVGPVADCADFLDKTNP